MSTQADPTQATNAMSGRGTERGTARGRGTENGEEQQGASTFALKNTQSKEIVHEEEPEN